MATNITRVIPDSIPENDIVAEVHHYPSRFDEQEHTDSEYASVGMAPSAEPDLAMGSLSSRPRLARSATWHSQQLNASRNIRRSATWNSQQPNASSNIRRSGLQQHRGQPPGPGNLRRENHKTHDSNQTTGSFDVEWVRQNILCLGESI